METGNKQIFTAAIVVILILIIYLAATNNTVNTPDPKGGEIETPGSEATKPAPVEEVKQEVKSAPAPTPAVTVNYTDAGYVTSFSPSIITIYKDQSVLFINLTNSSMRITSDEYKGLDQEAAVLKGGTYQFTFKERGRWKFYNAVNPAKVGTVIVK